MRNRAECVGEFATEYRTHTDHTVDVLTRLRYRPDVRLTHGRARRRAATDPLFTSCAEV